MTGPSYDYRRQQAMLLIEQTEDPTATAEDRLVWALTAVAHLLVAGQPPAAPQSRTQPSTLVTMLVLAMLCGTILAVVWLVSR